MKVIISVLVLLVSWPVLAEQEPVVIQETESQSAFKGLFYRVWNKFKSINPKPESRSPRQTTVTAGIRGAETTTTLLQPYWKDDKTSDKQFMKQLEAFAQAQALADEGKLEQAGSAFASFVEEWPQSDLRPNAQFAHAMTLGAQGKAAESRAIFKAFMDTYPDHPMVEDARVLVSELK